MLWNIAYGKIFAIRKLDERRDLNPAQKMHLARKYDIDEWIGPTFQELMKKGIHNMTMEDMELMGSDTFLILSQTTKNIDDMRLYVAYCCPAVQEAPGCTTHAACVKDWQESWWNGFCKHLLHPEKILSGHNAIHKIESAKFHQMSEDCLDLTVESIRQSGRLDYRQKLINEGIAALMLIHDEERRSRIVGPSKEQQAAMDMDCANSNGVGADEVQPQ